MIRINLLGAQKGKNKRSAASAAAVMEVGDVGSPKVKVLVVLVLAGLVNAGYVEALFHVYLGRDADPGGLAYWIGRLGAHTVTRAGAARALQVSKEAVGRRVHGRARFRPQRRGRVPIEINLFRHHHLIAVFVRRSAPCACSLLNFLAFGPCNRGRKRRAAPAVGAFCASGATEIF